MHYNIDKNTRVYYIWSIRYDKYLCKWSDLMSSTSSERGREEWTVVSNYRFVDLTFHKRTANDPTQPDLPSDLNYPSYPPSKYGEMQYIKWRVVKSSTYNGEPQQVSYVSSPGDDYWRQSTPFEYELTQSVPMFCAQTPQIPSFTNTVLKDDGYNYYRKFRARWAYDPSGILVYVSGPTYMGTVQERGNDRWTYEGKTYADSVLGTVYEIVWTSYRAGIGTSPNKMISDEIRTYLLSLSAQGSSVSSMQIASSNVLIGQRTFVEQTYSGYPVYRVTYDCSLQSFGTVELIALDQETNQKRNNSWEFVDLYSESNVAKCVFYYYSSNYQSNITLAQATALTLPLPDAIDLYDCPCYWAVNILDTLNATKFITVIVSGVEGRASSGNNIYKLPKIDEENTWKLTTSTDEIVLKYVDDNWIFSLFKNYKDNNYLKISKTISLSGSFVGNFRIVFNDSASFTDEDGSGTCMLSFEGNILEDYTETVSSTTEAAIVTDEESSSSSSSDNEPVAETVQLSEQTAIAETAVDTTTYIYEDYYGPEQAQS